jgi:hypothetical protein
VPGMFTFSEGASPSANLMEVKASEAQGRHREVGSEGSVEQRCEPTHRNWIERRQGRTSEHEITKSISIKGRQRKSSGYALTERGLTPGGLRRVLGSRVLRKKGLQSRAIGPEPVAGVSRGHSRCLRALKA